MPEFDRYAFFALAAIVVSLIRYGTYFITIYKGQTKPHAFSWALWGVMTGIAAFAQLKLGGGPSVWALFFVAATCSFIAILSLFIGEKNYTRLDWLALAGALAAIPVWQMTNEPLAALLMLMVIDALSYTPTIRKTYAKPDTEPPISCFWAGFRYFLVLFSVPDATWQTLIYPFFLMASDWGVAILIVVRRWQLGMPLHEYAKPKAQ